MLGPLLLTGCFFFGMMYRPIFRVGVTDLQVAGVTRAVQGDSVEDHGLHLRWEFPARKMKVTIINGSASPVTIDWPNARLTSFTGGVYDFLDISKKKYVRKSATVVRPGQTVVEWIYPTGLVDPKGWRMRMYPNMVSQHRDHVEQFGQKNLGRHARVELPVTLADGTTHSYDFTLTTLEFEVEKFIGT